MKRRLSLLAILLGCLVTLEATTPAYQTGPASSTTGVWYCERLMNDETCVWYCCSDMYCYESPC